MDFQLRNALSVRRQCWLDDCAVKSGSGLALPPPAAALEAAHAPERVTLPLCLHILSPFSSYLAVTLSVFEHVQMVFLPILPYSRPAPSPYPLQPARCINEHNADALNTAGLQRCLIHLICMLRVNPASPADDASEGGGGGAAASCCAPRRAGGQMHHPLPAMPVGHALSHGNNRSSGP